nr:MAG TPA: hypothetical protein [Caudoviricetes sp.]DAP20721.1 MAG TPA: hypothetical protein [Caudoviricetes sp.]
MLIFSTYQTPSPSMPNHALNIDKLFELFVQFSVCVLTIR